MEMKVLVTDPVHPDSITRLKEEGYSVTELEDGARDRLKDFIAPYHAMVCRTSTTCDSDVFANAPNLKAVAIASTGYDRIDTEEAKRRGVAILGLPAMNHEIDPEKDGNFVSTAEHTMLLILSVLGDFYQAYESMKEGRWDKKFLVGNELANKTVGLFGFGRIATLVARRLKAFRVNVIAHDPYATPEKAKEEGVELVSFEEFCKRSDLISIHAPRTPETEGKLNAEAFAQMKDGVFIVNTARAIIINEPDLIEALKAGKVKRVAMDVFHDEPNGVHQGMSRKLIEMPCVIATPHIGGSTHEAWRRISMTAAENVIAHLKGEVVKNRIA
ncbi:MAG: hydroxyacid dehydrogenase [Candidatus Pacebacteria bacterium]|nr:hydroxyacid dehydrogenase [Candidatus Paceibacterota bacterium]MBP9840723.1 hydroxyacid dehydrogenase [Candidatus Paceibacterota bacterium]